MYFFLQDNNRCARVYGESMEKTKTNVIEFQCRYKKFFSKELMTINIVQILGDLIGNKLTWSNL